MRDRVLYVDIEHQKLRAKNEGFQKLHAARVGELARGSVAGARCAYVWYGDLAERDLDDPSLLAVFVSGNDAEWDDYATGTASLEAMKRFLTSRESAMPVIAVCGGHQLLAMAHGVPVVHMPPDKNEDGFPTVTLEAPNDPIFAGVSRSPTFMQSHHDEVSSVPDGFALLASSPVCRVQALRLARAPRIVYSTQFHPEQDKPDTVPEGDGSRLLRNFFALAAASTR